MNLNKGASYTFATSGKGDPSLYIFSESQAGTDNIISGEPVAKDYDGAKDKRNCRLTFEPPESGGYYMEIILYAGSKWQGKVEYKKN